MSNRIIGRDKERKTLQTCLASEQSEFVVIYGDKASRKNLTIPAWLNTFGETNNINFSKVLQEALTALAIARTTNAT